jgi:hypothetical protein
MPSDVPYSSPIDLAEEAQSKNLYGWVGAQIELKLPKTTATSGFKLDVVRWNKLYPYCLILAKAYPNEDNTGTTYKETDRFVLPIAPEQLQIQTPFAIVTTKTLGGVVEEHNGIPFKLIAASGSTGVWPTRPAPEAMGGGIGNTGIGAGTISAAKQTASSFNELFGGEPAAGNSGPSDAELLGTGYAQFHMLRCFLENYAAGKKKGNNAYRLMFVSWKDTMAYIVSPILFNMRRDASNPLKYRYDLQLRAWGEVPSRTLVNAGVPIATAFEAPLLLKILNKIMAAQKLILSAVSLVNAFRADVQKVLDVIRQVILAVKMLVQLVIAIIDLPLQLYNDLKAIVVDSWKQVEVLFTGTGPGTFKGSFAAYSAGKQNATLTGRSYAVPVRPGTRPGSPIGNVGPLVNGASLELLPSILDEIFAAPYTQMASEFLSTITIDKLSLTPEMQKKIDAELERVRAFTAADYARMRDTVMEVMVSIADTVGASDATFDSTYNNLHAITTRRPNLEDFNILFAINDVVDALNKLSTMPDSANASASKLTNVTADYIAGLASGAGIAFQTPVSKYAVPFPYDYTLEHLARQYLGSADRWLEIATLNGLREPYVDELGFTLSLLANGNMSQIVVDDATNLKIGQPIWLQSNFVGREKRHIVNIKILAANNVILTLDGAADLDKYKVTAGAYLHAFLPDTVNSQQLIYIPSDTEVPDTSELAKIPGVDAFDNLLEIGGVDLLLTMDNDLAITNDGDCRLAYGMSAIIQRARVALGTPRGSLFRHPTFGLPLQIGQSIADLTAKDLAAATKDLFAGDPAFDGITSVVLSQKGPVVDLKLGLYVTNQESPISLALEVKR